MKSLGIVIGLLSLRTTLCMEPLGNIFVYKPDQNLGDLDRTLLEEISNEDSWFYRITPSNSQYYIRTQTGEMSPPPTKYAMLLCDGQKGNLRVSRGPAQKSADVTGLDTYILDYRGYPPSRGIPSEEGIIEDGLLVLDKLMTDYDGNVFIHGTSLGGAVAIALAYERQIRKSEHKQVKGMILESAFTSIPDCSLLGWFMTMRLIDTWDSEKRIRSLKNIPMYFLTGGKDNRVPAKLTDKLQAAYAAPSDESDETDVFYDAYNHNTLYDQSDFFPAAQHNNMKEQEDYYEKLAEWIWKQIASREASV